MHTQIWLYYKSHKLLSQSPYYIFLLLLKIPAIILIVFIGIYQNSNFYIYIYIHLRPFKKFSDIINVVLIFWYFNLIIITSNYIISRWKTFVIYILIYSPFPKLCFIATNREEHINAILTSVIYWIRLSNSLKIFWYSFHGCRERIWYNPYLRSFNERNAQKLESKHFKV